MGNDKRCVRNSSNLKGSKNKSFADTQDDIESETNILYLIKSKNCIIKFKSNNYV